MEEKEHEKLRWFYQVAISVLCIIRNAIDICSTIWYLLLAFSPSHYFFGSLITTLGNTSSFLKVKSLLDLNRFSSLSIAPIAQSNRSRPGLLPKIFLKKYLELITSKHLHLLITGWLSATDPKQSTCIARLMTSNLRHSTQNHQPIYTKE